MREVSLISLIILPPNRLVKSNKKSDDAMDCVEETDGADNIQTRENTQAKHAYQRRRKKTCVSGMYWPADLINSSIT